MRPSLRLLSLLGLLSIAATPALAGCVKDKLLDQVRLDERETREAPPKAEGDSWMVKLHESAFEMDGYRITARVEPALKQAWVRRSGGIAGWIEWLGPYAVEPDSLKGCPPAISPVEDGLGKDPRRLKTGSSLPQ